MKPPPFAYHRPETLAEAVDLLARLGDDARVLAGGQSLIPVLNFRLTSPSDLVDLNGVSELDYLRESDDGGLEIGAMTRQRTAERDPVVARAAPLLARALPWVAHAAIRNRGTVGGSLAHADPASELPAVMLALDAEMEVVGPAGSRSVKAEDFFPGLFATALQPGEILRQVRIPPPGPGRGFAFQEVARRRGDFALAGVAAAVTLAADDSVLDARIGLLGVGTGPILARTAAGELVGRRPDEGVLAGAAEAAAGSDASPLDDVHAGADYRRQLVRVLTARALAAACRDAGGRGP